MQGVSAEVQFWVWPCCAIGCRGGPCPCRADLEVGHRLLGSGVTGVSESPARNAVFPDWLPNCTGEPSAGRWYLLHLTLSLCQQLLPVQGRWSLITAGCRCPCRGPGRGAFGIASRGTAVDGSIEGFSPQCFLSLCSFSQSPALELDKFLEDVR